MLKRCYPVSDTNFFRKQIWSSQSQEESKQRHIENSAVDFRKCGLGGGGEGREDSSTHVTHDGLGYILSKLGAYQVTKLYNMFFTTIATNLAI